MGSAEEFIKLFGRHFVSLGWLDRSPAWAHENEGRGRNFSTSAFVVSIRDTWFIITAGHILADIEDALAKGQLLVEFRLDDGWGANSKYAPQRFHFPEAKKFHYFDKEEGVDCAAITIDGNTKSRLITNGVEAMDERVWKNGIPDVFETHFIVGMPSIWQSTRPLQTAFELSSALVLFGLEKLAEPPPGFESTLLPRFYGKVLSKLKDSEGKLLTDLDGMSGSPIFGFNRVPGGAKYWLIAIQSVTDTETKCTYVAGSLFLQLGLFLEAEIIKDGD